MRTFTIDQYIRMAEKFNKMSFRDKIITIRDNSDILTLASDHNWWGVKAKDKEICEQLDEMEVYFEITNEWDSNEMNELVDLLGIWNTDI